MVNINKLTDNYRCPKCRDKTAIIRKASLSKSSLQSIFPIAAGKYILLTCSLCGYTEIYDAAVYEKAEQEAETKSRLPEQAGPSV